ncbi:uroporphyrinogen-III synthase [Acinetobacter stercoris]|uniref:Uroporphyrinogen-III synthase n=1 Tax=Acinetobacter stercoris TaxID=2126983 RepID=A0A2U3N2H6_9GAMM|nr:uroporphyrinogen-III synthase [Acinetobacter stercoris]SPL71890.1 Uroporphyrinogen-III synthase [Acinetobacter stercoris]
MLFINTRPKDRAERLTEVLTRSGVKVIDFPLLILSAIPLSKQLEQLYSQLDSVEVIVVVSPTAANIGMQYLQQSGLQLSRLSHIQWIAVGQATATTLSRYGIRSDVPRVETSEGMLDLDIFKQQKNLQAVAFWRGEGGRQFMMQSLLDQGIQVFNFLLYERHCPEQSKLQFSELKHEILNTEDTVVMCISSEASWRNWLNLCQNQIEILQKCYYLVLGERLYQILQHDKKMQHIHFKMTQVNSLEPDILRETIAGLPRVI